MKCFCFGVLVDAKHRSPADLWYSQCLMDNTYPSESSVSHTISPVCYHPCMLNWKLSPLGLSALLLVTRNTKSYRSKMAQAVSSRSEAGVGTWKRRLVLENCVTNRERTWECKRQGCKGKPSSELQPVPKPLPCIPAPPVVFSVCSRQIKAVDLALTALKRSTRWWRPHNSKLRYTLRVWFRSETCQQSKHSVL